MRIRIGPLPVDVAFNPEQNGWQKLKTPSFDIFLLLAIPISVLLTAGVLSLWSLVNRVHGMKDQLNFVLAPRVLLGSLLALVALVLLHELSHALALPGFGLTPATTLGFWPQKFTPYVDYQGELSRDRYTLAGMMPFMLLSILPILVGLLFAWTPLWLVLLSSLNAFFSAGDLIGTLQLVLQTRRSTIIRSQGLDTWWRDVE